MGALPLFLVLLGCTTWSALLLRHRILLLRKGGLGGAEEDLDRARAVARAATVNAVVLLAAGAAAIVVGERWAAVWRAAAPGIWVLNGLLLVLALCLVWSFGCGVRQQWSAEGSFAGMMLGLLGFAVSGGLIALVGHWLGA